MRSPMSTLRFSPLVQLTVLLGSLFTLNPAVLAQSAPKDIAPSILDNNPFEYACPLLLKPLLAEVLPEASGYINRSLLRQAPSSPDRHYFIGFGVPEYGPLPLEDFSDRYPELNLQELTGLSPLYQVFLTSQERRYTSAEIINFQQFHWLFFHQNDRFEWNLVRMVSQTELAPLRDSSDEAIALGIQHRLAQCWR